MKLKQHVPNDGALSKAHHEKTFGRMNEWMNNFIGEKNRISQKTLIRALQQSNHS